MPNNRKRQNIGIFIDEANIYHSQKTLGWKVDYLKLKEHFEKIGKIKVLNFYTSFMDKNIYQKDRFNKLQKNGFKIIKKQLKFIKTMSGLIIKKGNLD
ncbi:MAG TPA: NYN domain-containing protein, partial [Candidatus Paceibacterota bacterium]|nr:NYN domain-containing protein [Candidatus Paceibacterota bacterium]